MSFVSCIMPTRDRRGFVSQAIWYFLRQQYALRELIIVDDGQDRIEDLIPADDRIRYIHLNRPAPLGRKLNIACEMSRGEFIAHWEDDDWMSPFRLQTQVERLVRSGKDAGRPAEVLHYLVSKGESWLYRDRAAARLRMLCGPVIYRRRGWEKGAFEESRRSGESAFPPGVPDDQILVEPDSPYYLKILHAEGAAPRNLRDSVWQQVPLSVVADRIAGDLDFYASLRVRKGESRKRRVDLKNLSERITVAAPFMVYDGYGSVAQYIVLGMLRSGACIDVAPFQLDCAGMTGEFQAALAQSRPRPESPALCFCWPPENLSRFRNARDLFLYTMWEYSKLPAGWNESINRARAVFVPTRFVAGVFRESGVHIPIEVVPQGVDPAVYHYEERPERESLTTLMVGAFVPRKNIEIGIEAWKQAFPKDPNARLLIKSRFRVRKYEPDDPRIEFVDSEETTLGIAHWYRRADVLLALGNEGFGLPLVEGMATGLPVIALDSEGQADVCREAGDRLLPVSPDRWVPFVQEPFGDCGVRAVPSAEAVAKRLRWVATHRGEARDMGAKASTWAIGNRNLWETGPLLLDHMERLAIAPRPLRRLRTFWVPSWNTPCGISEYTMHLAGQIGAVRISAKPPDARGVSLLHVQHEYGIVSDAEMMATLKKNRDNRIRTVVTMHTVRQETQSWEHYSDAIIVLNRTGEQWLRRRHPEKKIAYLPHGCPTWFPKRKIARNKVIGVFGFLSKSKGLWTLLEALNRIEGAELLMFSHAKSAEIESEWRSASAGLPVRRESGFPPSEEIAARLAAEADILVYWYDDIPHASTSGAVCIGLATGVPVLTSRSRMFDEVRDVVYQPHDLVEGIEQLLSDTPLRDRLTGAARQYCHENRWERVAALHEAFWQSLQSLP